MRKSRIISSGRYLPPRVVTNFDLMKFMETSDEWIQQRTGIVERHWVDEGVGTSDLGAEAAKAALKKANMDIKDIDFMIFATLSPDYTMPGSGVLVQDKLGGPTIGALDVRNQCSGFIYGLSIADQFIRTGTYDHVLVMGAEVHSTGFELANRGRDVTVIFGDGGGAVILGPSEDDKRGILSCHLHSEGKYFKMLWCENPASIYHPRCTHEQIEDGSVFPKMNGKVVFKHALQRFPEVIMECLNANGLTIKDVDLFIMHQANLRICQFVASQFEIPEEKVFNNIMRYGNTTAASLPIALDEAWEQGKIKEGDLVCLSSFGAGFTWASALIRW